MSSENIEPMARARSAGRNFDLSTAEYDHAQKSKFHFKSAKRKARDDEDLRSSSKADNHSHRHHHRSKRRKQPKPGNNPTSEKTYLPFASPEQDLDPDTAFRESLFDAMADDEGAQFWESVYGQPIPKVCPVKKGQDGKLEAMTEDEYAAHVRAEMYKKTHQYLFEEKQRREKEKKERDRLTKHVYEEKYTPEQFKRVVDESLQKGKERKERAQRASQWAKRWSTYEEMWDELENCKSPGTTKLPWPVLGGIRDDIRKQEVEKFYLNGPTSGEPDQADLIGILKAERIRWHPDKMQQKLGGLGVDEVDMRAITAVFQIVDRMWREVRDPKI